MKGVKRLMTNQVLLTLFFILAISYLIICITIYAKQKNILFPTNAIKAVPMDWQPSGADTHQTMIPGSCGELHVAIWRTPNAKGTLMMHHGNGESLASIDDYVAAFHDLDYNLMAWDYPGYGKSTDCNFNQKMLLADAESAYQWLTSQEKPENIHQFGYSLGTGIALSVASRHQQNPVYLVAAYDSLKNVAIDAMPRFIPVNYLFRYPMKVNQWISTIKQPIYIMHGSHDSLIRPQRVQSLVDQSAGRAKLEWVEHAGHADDILFAYRNQWLKRLLP